MFGYIYFGVINLLTFCVFGVDKQRAMRHNGELVRQHYLDYR